MTRVLLKILFGLMLLTTGELRAQTAAEAEQQMKYYLDRIQYWRYQYAPGDSGVSLDAKPRDSVMLMNQVLEQYIAGHPAIMKMNFKTLDDAGLKIISSADKKLSIYSWNAETGSSAHNHNNVALFQTTTGARSMVMDEKKLNGLASDIYAAGRYYLIVSGGIISEKDAVKTINGFTIDNNSLVATTLFPSKNGDYSAILGYTYDYSANFDYKKMKEDYIIKFDKQKLYVPAPDFEGKLTGWNIYKFNGDKFELEK